MLNAINSRVGRFLGIIGKIVAAWANSAEYKLLIADKPVTNTAMRARTRVVINPRWEAMNPFYTGHEIAVKQIES